jgi:hypothetical protein
LSPNPIRLGPLEVQLLWFDSLGAKSSSFLVNTPDLRLLVDPGVAEMQPSYPLPLSERLRLRSKAFKRIVSAADRADWIFISHYHYDHHTLPEAAPNLYKGKLIWVKDPNLWINASQWERARLFLSQLSGDLKPHLRKPVRLKLSDPLADLPLARAHDYGDYQARKEELLSKGRRWFDSLLKDWLKNPWVSEFQTEAVEVRFADGKEVKKGRTRLRFTPPLFHGVEFARVGWVVGLVVEYGAHKILYTSDLQGPQIEDYAHWIIAEDPELLILDGPATYLFGYLLNRVNLNRAIQNLCTILEQISSKIIIYDHHNLREPRYQERLARVYEVAKRYKKRLLTAAELCGEEPLVLRLTAR